VSAHAPSGNHDPAAASEHASVRTYVKVAVVLTLITALEVGVIYIRQLSPIIVPLLLAMSAAKFALVMSLLGVVAHRAPPTAAGR
jgi:hypothetical protein